MKCTYCNKPIKDLNDFAIHIYECHKDKCIWFLQELFKQRKIRKYLEKNMG
jgi:hypothetical protein